MSDRQEFVKSGHRIAVDDERFADEYNVGARGTVVSDIGGRLHGGFCDTDDAGRNPIGQSTEEVLVEFECAQVASIDPDERRALRRPGRARR
jgi:hypothetical protein